jgi:hypothetical protein
MSVVSTKEPATLIRQKKQPILAALHTQSRVFHVVQVSVKGGSKYALGIKQPLGGYRWVISPTDKNKLWKVMQEHWNITVANVN